MSWELVYTRQAKKDAKKIARSGLKPKAQALLTILADNPYQNPPPYEKLVADLAGAYSRRINIQHRLVYQIYAQEKVVKVIRLWTHYGIFSKKRGRREPQRNRREPQRFFEGFSGTLPRNIEKIRIMNDQKIEN